MASPITAPTRSKKGLLGRIETVTVTNTLTAAEVDALVAGDALVSILIPYDATVIDIEMDVEDLDDGANLDLDIGFPENPDYFTATPIEAAAAIYWRYTTDVAVPTQYTFTGTDHQTSSLPNDPKCVLSAACAVAASTGAAGDITLTVHYRS